MAPLGSTPLNKLSIGIRANIVLCDRNSIPHVTIFCKFCWQKLPKQLTLKWPRYFYSRWCPRGGGFHGTPLKKIIFPPEFCNEICTIYVRAIKITILQKKIWKCCTVSKWQPNNLFLFRVISILAKIWKTTFPRKESLNEILLKVGEYEYIYITEITLKKKLFRFKMAAKTIFWYCAIMLIYAN